ncbi:MAG TPA: hypothetical protein VK981_05245 [Ramlibacter sp.]|nr:hypothetical protein [Ramlibacter sp.]
MGVEWITGLGNWWSGLTPDMKFLFALPFAVGMAPFVRDAIQKMLRCKGR